MTFETEYLLKQKSKFLEFEESKNLDTLPKRKRIPPVEFEVDIFKPAKILFVGNNRLLFFSLKRILERKRDIICLGFVERFEMLKFHIIEKDPELIFIDYDNFTCPSFYELILFFYTRNPDCKIIFAMDIDEPMITFTSKRYLCLRHSNHYLYEMHIRRLAGLSYDSKRFSLYQSARRKPRDIEIFSRNLKNSPSRSIKNIL